MKKTQKKISLFILLSVALFSSSSFAIGEKPQDHKSKVCETCEKNPEAALKANMRKAWEDHIVWTRNVILCLVDDLPGADQASKRLLQNQTDIGDAIKPYYGDEAGNKLSNLLYSHINIAVDVIKSAKTANATALDAANKKWAANANEISEFLCSANPNWNLTDMKAMMNDHLKLTTDEVVQRINKNYDADVLAYDKVHTEILEMSDMLAFGIIKQYPDKFKKGKGKAVAKIAAK